MLWCQYQALTITGLCLTILLRYLFIRELSDCFVAKTSGTVEGKWGLTKPSVFLYLSGPDFFNLMPSLHDHTTT